MLDILQEVTSLDPAVGPTNAAATKPVEVASDSQQPEALGQQNSFATSSTQLAGRLKHLSFVGLTFPKISKQ